MMTRTKLALLFVISTFLFACGDSSTSGDSSTTLSGVVAAGMFTKTTPPGKVSIYAVNDAGIRAALPLKTVDIDVAADGTSSFTANIGAHTGPVVALAYGTYIDEATGAQIILTEANALRAALPDTAIKAGTVKMNITALTTVAVAQASPAATFTSAAISASNTNVGLAFGITDALGVPNITGITPVVPTAAELAKTTVTDSQKKYTALLAVLSQYVAKLSADPASPTPAEVIAALSGVAGTMTGSTIGGSTALALQTAATDLTARTGNAVVDALKGATATSGYVNSVKDGSLLNGGVAITIFPLKLRTVGTGVIGSIQTAVTLPAGVSIFPNSTVGISTATGALIATNTVDQKTRISLAKADGITVGEFLTIYCGAATAPAISAITISDTKITDLDGAIITTYTVEPF